MNCDKKLTASLLLEPYRFTCTLCWFRLIMNKTLYKNQAFIRNQWTVIFLPDATVLLVFTLLCFCIQGQMAYTCSILPSWSLLCIEYSRLNCFEEYLPRCVIMREVASPVHFHFVTGRSTQNICHVVLFIIKCTDSVRMILFVE